MSSSLLSRPQSYAIMASGTGTNALALIDQGIDIGRPPAFVIVNREDSALLKTVPTRSVPIFYIPAKKSGIDENFEEEVVKKCREYQVEWVFLAGFMKVLGSTFLGAFKQEDYYRVVNIHPSLLPKYPGLGGYKQAMEAGDLEFGHTLHLVNEGVDEGPILYQKVLKRDESLSLEELIEYGKTFENRSYRQILLYILKNGLTQKDIENQIAEGDLPQLDID